MSRAGSPSRVFRLGPESCNGDSVCHLLWLIVQGTQEYKAPEVFNDQQYVASKVREQSWSISMPVPQHTLSTVIVPQPSCTTL